jgi:hypothetical protein
MKKAVALLAVLVILAGVVVPSEAWARGFRGGHHGCCWGWWWPGAIIGGLALGAAVAATYPYPAYAAPTVVYQPAPVYTQPAPVYTAPPAYSAPAVQREVVYPQGRYVLYGDGMSQPWQWVWVPASPVPPPPPPPR